MNLQCQGECNKNGECTGDVKEVTVYGTFCPKGLNFDYCQTAREEDERRGFVVEIIEEIVDEEDLTIEVTNPNERQF